MADNPNPDDDDFSYYQKTVVLRDWWLIKCSIEFQGKRFGVAGTQISETGAVRVFTSSPIIKAYDVFTLESSDGVCIILRGFLNKQRLLQSGFLPQISREFIFGFPPGWESKCNLSFLGLPSQPPPLHNKEDSSPSVVVKKTEETNDKDGLVGCSSRKKSLRLQSRSVQLMVIKTSNDGGEGLSKAKTGGVSKDECKIKKHTGGADNVVVVDKVTSLCATKDSSLTTTEQRKGKMKKVTKTSPSDSSSKRGKSKKSDKFLKGGGLGVVSVEPTTTHSRSKVKDKLSVGNTIRKIDFDEEVTPKKDAKKQKANNAIVSADSSGQKRSRSGRLLVSPLEFWRNQVPVYDLDRNLIQVKEGYQTNSTPPSKGKGSEKVSRAKKMKIK